MKFFIQKHLCKFFLFSSIFLCVNAYAVEKSPINIAADKMTATEKNNSVTFSGNVDASQGDVRIRSDKMVVYYTPKKDGQKDSAKSSSPKQQVEKMICTGGVEITRGKWLGTANRLDYLERKRKVILSGNAKAWQDKNMVNGSKIIYYLDEGRSEVIASKASLTKDGKKKGGRVQMTILQK